MSPAMIGIDQISVCICTYKRPDLLRRLLERLDEQKTAGLFDYSAVIVDNDKSESARETAELYARQLRMSISYHVEPEQNIALARNRAIENASGDYVALIDDDEFPNESLAFEPVQGTLSIPRRRGPGSGQALF